jgi:protein-disulfide isomerase
MKEAQTAEVRGTPTIFVNGKRVMNRSVDGFKQMIDEAKAKG